MARRKYTDEERIQRHREHQRKYRNANKEKIAENERQYYIENREGMLEQHKKYKNDNKEKMLEYRRQRRIWFMKWYDKQMEGKICIMCSSSEDLDFHHIDPSTKRFNISDGVFRKRENVVAEMTKCKICCRNCHLKVHRDLRYLERQIKKGNYYFVKPGEETPEQVKMIRDIIDRYCIKSDVSNPIGLSDILNANVCLIS